MGTVLMGYEAIFEPENSMGGDQELGCNIANVFYMARRGICVALAVLVGCVCRGGHWYAKTPSPRLSSILDTFMPMTLSFLSLFVYEVVWSLILSL
jgi:hypothetical protein